MNVHVSGEAPTPIRRANGFTLVEVLIAIVLSALMAGVVVAGLLTALSISRSTTDQVGDSNDAGLISSFLVRDAQSAGGIDPATALPDSTLGVSTLGSDHDAFICSGRPASETIVRFSWIDRTSMSVQTNVVVVYSLHDGELTRRVCATNSPSVDALLGTKIQKAVATCVQPPLPSPQEPPAFCAGHPDSVSLELKGQGTGAPLNYTLTASLRSASSLLTILRPTDMAAARRGIPYASTATSTVGASGLTSWSATGLEPLGLSIDPLSGMVWGTPNPHTSFPVSATITLTVTDTQFHTVATKQYPIVIHAPPVAVADTYTVNEDTPLVVAAATGVLAVPDSHLEGGALTANLASGVAHGTLALGTDGAFTYTPEPNWNGIDTFRYVANDGLLSSSPTTVTLNVTAVNDPPANQVPAARETQKNTPLVFSNGSNRLSITDIDAGETAIVQVQLTATGGTVTLPGATGLTSPTGSGTSTMTIKGTIAKINLSLVNATFTPTTNFTGAATLTMITSDLGNTGAGAATTDTDVIPITVTSLGIFSGNQNIGTAAASGTTSLYGAPTYTVKGSGWDIWENNDGFQYIYRPMTGDGSLTARIVTEDVTYPGGSNSNPVCWAADFSHQQLCASVAKAGVMFRQNLTSVSAIDAMVGVTQGNGSEFIFRTAAGSGTAAVSPADDLHVPYWVRLTRRGTQITAETSPNGSTWTQRGAPQTIAFAPTVYVGLAVSAVNQLSGDDPRTKLNSATFDNVSISTPPTASADAYSANQNTALVVSAPSGVLVNDSDPEGTGLNARLATGTTGLVLNADGSFTYTPPANFTGTTTFTYSANDGVLDSIPATVTILVKPVANGAPSFTKGGDQSIRTNLGAQTVTGWATAISPGAGPGDAGQLVDFIVTNNNVPLFSVQPSISADGTLVYAPAAATNGVPTRGTATVTVAAHDNGGTTNGGVDTSAPQTFVITILAPPVLTTTRGGLAYTENDPATVLDPGIIVTDADSTSLASATVTIATGYVNGQDVLAFVNQSGITGSWNAATGMLTMTGPATIDAYQSALRSVTYFNFGDNPPTSSRTVTFVANDGLLTSTTAVRTVAVTAVNDAPVNAVPGPQTTSTGFAKVFSGANGNLISIGDVDAGGGSMQVQLNSTNGTASLSGVAELSFATGDGTADADMTFSGTVVNINAALAGMSFAPNDGFTGTATLAIKTSDQGNSGTGGALGDDDTVALTVVSAACPTTITGWRGQYFDNATLSGSAMLCRDDANINFTWGRGAPDPILPTDNFSVRWTKAVTFAAGYYTFTVGSDDGSRVLIDGVVVPALDQWRAQSYTTVARAVFLAEGTHTITMEYYEQGGDAAATLSWAASAPATCSVSATGWLGQYFSNSTFSGTPAECRDDPNINFNWGGGAPIAGMPSDRFSVRWTKTQTFAAGEYSFILGGDDGVRLFVDGVLVPSLNSWTDHGYPGGPTTANKTMTAGAHVLVVEFYENGGGAQATLDIINPLAFSGFTNTYWSGPGSTAIYYRSTATSGSFTTVSTSMTAGITSYGFPSLGTNWTSTAGAQGVNTYSWSGTPAAPGTKFVTATNTSGLTSTGAPFTLIVDDSAPTPGTVTYPDGSTNGSSVSVSFTTGTDAGSGVGTRLLQRQSAPLGKSCGAFGAFATVANGTNPTSPVTDAVTIGNCYRYQYVVSDNVGNIDTASSPNVVKVKKTYFDTIMDDPGLLSYWRLAETSGTSIADSAGTNQGTYPSGRPLGTTAGALAGDADTATTFDGVNDYGRVSRKISTNFSIEFWFKSTQGIGTSGTWSSGAGLVDANASSGTAYDFGVALRSDGVVIAGVRNSSIMSGSGGYDDGGWHHVVFTRSASNGALRLYVDGALAASGSGVTNALTATTYINFGRIQTGGSTYYSGALDEVAMYSTVLDEATVSAHYNAGF